MIKIQNITIANYRSFKDKGNTLNNLNDINVMVGKNNVGKTNVLRAIYLFFNPQIYNPIIDRNMIKQITGGGTKEPKIHISFEDDEVIKNEVTKYTIVCDLNKPNYYSISEGNEEVNSKLENSSKIQKYINSKFQCIYLSTTDENISNQSEKLINAMILKYFEKKDKKIKETIQKFEEHYSILTENLRNNILDIESDLVSQFDVFNDIGLDIKPKLEIISQKKVTQFLLENINLKLDDSYVHELNNKGAGIQRTSLILISLFLLDEIFSRQNKIILLDEPEAFLYPLLIRKIKLVLEERAINNENFQMFLTTHSVDFLKELNNKNYNFVNITQSFEEASYVRSKNEVDINKYSVLNKFDDKTKYEVLKNYGILDDVNDYKSIIICEGETDKNYLLEILKAEEFYPQIRYGKYSDGLGDVENSELDYKYIGRGASSILPILIYLDKVSDVKRKVFILLDGDDEGEKTFKKIREKEYKNLEIFKFMIPNSREIEDMVYSKEDFIRYVIDISEDIKSMEKEYRASMERIKDNESYVKQTGSFIQTYRLDSIKLLNIKHKLSLDLDKKNLKDEWILDKLREFFID